MARRTIKRRKPPGKRGRRIVRWLLWPIALFVLGSLALVILYRFVPPPITLTMIGDYVDGRGITVEWTPLDRIHPDMPRAAIAAEDGNFCRHNGFDYEAIGKALAGNEAGRRYRGGSTISQQTAKNVFLWQGRSWVRKGLEAWFTVLIEALWTKRRIMEVYLNVAETGRGTYGVTAGAIRYFNHGAGSLNRTEAARIAAILPLPKQREAIAPTGFVRRYGDRIARRIPAIRRAGLDACVRG